jgi:nucleoside-diphosphate-sugar epimerase
MIALVTGSNGFLGSHLVEGLLARGYEVHCLVRRTSDLTRLRGLPVRFVYGDVTSESSLREAVAAKDYVYHAAGAVKGTSQRAFDRVNSRGTANLLRACWKWNAGVKRLVLISSLSAAGPSTKGRLLSEDDPPRPVSRYGASKLKGEEEASKYMERLPLTIVRPPVIFGPRDRGMQPFFRMLKKGIVLLLSGERLTNFVYVKDAVEGTVLAAESDRAAGRTYYIAGKHACGWREFAEVAARVMGVRPLMVSVPAVAAKIVGGVNSLAAALTGRARFLDWQKAREMVQPHWLCDISKAKRELGYRPSHSLEDALADTVQWYEKEGWI